MQEEIIDPDTGEVLESVNQTTELAIPTAAFTGGDIINQLEDGQFQQDFHAKVAALLETMNEVSQMTGGKSKGKVTLTLDFTKEDNAFRIASKIAVKEPEIPRPRSIAWTDNHGNLTRFPPGQMQMLNIRSVGGNGGLRRV